ncbi:MAG: J domain-containing protein [Eubacteriales bacterium]
MAKKGFCDGYKTYNPEVEGYGNANQWQDAFKERMGWKEAKGILGDTDPYDVLELEHNATWEEIHKQYRKMAIKWHPDKNPTVDTTEQMQKVSAAYVVLKKMFNVK